ncbi:hypothetical protein SARAHDANIELLE_65 [Hafnia phage vB_HpaM_SarahDanielle]|uniref:Uncharacterized protein n=1 Tax=Hafnia phage vB_HpaM_SarahDanielle TaxID=2836113 RepID=A0AAE7W9P2_9CAUD|nr:hypothetical protein SARAHDANIELLE_65 [Hafnia phage vB_HpaM_SarahDanielle]
MTMTYNSIQKETFATLAENLCGKQYDSFDDFEFYAVDDLDAEVREVIYYHDAWAIINDSDFNGFAEDDLDFSGCKSAQEAVMYEANSMMYNVASSILGDFKDDLYGVILAAKAFCDEKGFEVNRVYCEMGCNLDSLPHNYETEFNGYTCCVWEDYNTFAIDVHGARITVNYTK